MIYMSCVAFSRLGGLGFSEGPNADVTKESADTANLTREREREIESKWLSVCASTCLRG